MVAYKSKKFMRMFKSVGENVQVFEHALILKPENIILGDQVRIDDYCRIEGGNGTVIGSYSHIASFAGILGGGNTYIGKYVGIAQGARIVTGSGLPAEEYFPTPFPDNDPYFRATYFATINDYAILAVNSVLLPGVTVGEGGIVAAGSVATKDGPPWCIVAGIPAGYLSRREKS
jgi:galactoside O-acetyltransferase